MILPVYLALIQEEFYKPLPHGIHPGWMACEFSQADGLTNLPATLPEDCMLIISDSQVLPEYNEDLILSQLESLKAESILLDFQRPYDKKLQQLAEKIVAKLPCPVGVSHRYAEKLNCPVFLPPVPLNQTPKAYLQPWKGREIWLDTALDALEILVTETGSQFLPVQSPAPGKPVFIDTQLHCCYYTQVTDKAVQFTLYRTRETLSSLLASAETHGTTRCIGLYRELCEKGVL